MLGISMPFIESDKTKAVTRIMNLLNCYRENREHVWYILVILYQCTANFKCEYYGKDQTSHWNGDSSISQDHYYSFDPIC